MERLPANERATQGEKREVDMGPSLVADGQAPKAIEPGQRALHHPTVTAKALARLDTLACDTRDDTPLAAGQPAEGVVVTLAGVQLGGPLAGSAPLAAHRHNRVQRRLQLLAIVNVGRRERHCERDAGPVDHHMALAARFCPLAAIRRIRAGRFAPFLAATLAESSAARDKSRLSAACKQRRLAWCRCPHTLAACQSRSRQQVIPLPQPIS